MRYGYLPVRKGGDTVTKFFIENDTLRFSFDIEQGLRCTGIYHKQTGEEWLEEACVPFELSVRGERLPADTFRILTAQELSDGVDRALVFEMESSRPRIKVRVSLSIKKECLVFLVQAGAVWEDVPEEVYLHIPLMEHFSKRGSWYLSANPRPKPDGTPALETHEEFPLPICCIDKRTGHGIMLELPDAPEFTGTWNQNRNRQLLKITGEEEFLRHSLLLRLQNRAPADVLEIHFSGVTGDYKEAFFRYKEHIRSSMDLSMYKKEDLQWYRKALYHHLTFAYSREIFNYETGKFEVDRLLDEGESFGGYDILVLWFVYPRLGVDARTQWDFCDDIPGGIEGINEICRQAHRRGVRVMLPYNPWDEQPLGEQSDPLDLIAGLIEKTQIDGVWFDTMDSVPKGCRERIESIRKGVICCLEVTPRVRETVESITGSWNQRFCMPEGHVLRYLFPEHTAPMTSRWRVAEKKDTLIKRAVFNGTGFAIWQDVFGAWLPFDEKQRADLRRWKQLLLENYDTYFGKDCMPLYPTLREELYVNAFYHDNGREVIYSLYNASGQEVRGALFVADIAESDKGGASLEELWTKDGEPFVMEEKTVSGCVLQEKVYIFKVTCEQILL